MEFTTTTLGFVGLAAAAVIAIVLAWSRRRAATNRIIGPPSPSRPDSRRSTDWVGSDPVLFVGTDASAAD